MTRETKKNRQVAQIEKNLFLWDPLVFFTLGQKFFEQDQLAKMGSLQYY